MKASKAPPIATCRRFVGTIALAMLFGACTATEDGTPGASEQSSTSDEQPSENEQAQSSENDSENVQAPSSDNGDVDEATQVAPPESPLGDFLGFSELNTDQEEQEEQAAELERQLGEHIAGCMSAQGFDYVPVVRDFGLAGVGSDGLVPGTQEWTAKYGFGVSTKRFSQAQVGDGLVGNSTFDPSKDEPDDPNATYRNGLTPAEQGAYDRALFGDSDDVEAPWIAEGREPTDEEEQAFFDERFESYIPSGYQALASDEIYDNDVGDEEAINKFDDEFGNIFEETEERLKSHPDVIAYDQQTQDCVEVQGLEYFPNGTEIEYFEGLLDGAGLSLPDPLDGVDIDTLTDQQVEAAVIEAFETLLPQDQIDALAELQDLEIKTAVAANECGGSRNARNIAIAPARIETERLFLEENADRLSEFEGVFGN